MADVQDQVGSQLTSFFRRLTLRQKLALGVTTVAAVVTIVGLVSLANRPSFGTLFNNVAPQDASKVVEKLKERKIEYALEDNGKTILVPKEHIYELRLWLAGQGLPQSSIIGYEIFDRTNLGISEFVQKVNYRRALEGELARTILQLDEVEGARVHIVVPEKALFKDDVKPTTASVVLKLKSGRPLNRETIQGITHLISSSVEGLDASNVTLLDSRGKLLSDRTPQDGLTAMTSTQYELQQKVETYLAQKAQHLLDGVLGAGNAVVQVNAELDFRQVERTLEQYDAEDPAVRSEQVTEEKASAKDVPTPTTRTNTITNYEINKTVERIVESVGGIKRLSVAAMINGTQRVSEKDGEKTSEYVPRSQEEMDRLSDIIKKVVGFSSQRNDEISVVNLPFGTVVREQDLVTEEKPFADWNGIAEKILILAAMLAAILIVRSLLNRLRMQVSGRTDVIWDGPAVADLGAAKAAIHLPSPEEEIPAEVLLRTERRKKITEYIEQKPEEAARLLRVWLTPE